MKIVNQHVEVISIPTTDCYDLIANCGRTCYKSEECLDKKRNENFIRKLIKSGHESVLEHCIASFRITCDRGISHELVRHRLASYSQESTRYCDYENKELDFIIPAGITEGTVPFLVWYTACQKAEEDYKKLKGCGFSPEIARSVLPHSLKTEIVMTANLREWRHFLKLRLLGKTGKPHPGMIGIAEMILILFNLAIPVVFEDIWEEYTKE